MYKVLLLLSFFVSLSVLNAQSRWAFGLELEGGISGERTLEEDGYVLSNGIQVNYQDRNRYRLGRSAGAWLEYSLSTRAGLRLGANYAVLESARILEETGYTSTNQIFANDTERYEHRQAQLRIPLEGKFYFGRATHRWRPFVSAGVQGSYLLQHRIVKHDYAANSLSGEVFEDAIATNVNLDRPSIDRHQISLITGLGVRTDRITISLQRTWRGGEDNQRYGFAGGNLDCLNPSCIGPFFEVSVPRLHLTSLRFTYRLF